MFSVEYFDDVVYKGKPNRIKENFLKNRFTDFYNFIINEFKGESFLEKLYVFRNGGSKGCYCGNVTRFISFSRGYLEYCSITCSSNSDKTREKYKRTCLEKYGVDNVSNSDLIKNKKEKTFYARYGKSTYLQTQESKNKIISKLGVDNPFKSDKIQNKIRESNLRKYGTEFILQIPEIREKSKKTNLEKYGSDHFSKTSIWKDKMRSLNNNLFIESLDLPSNYSFISKNNQSNILKHHDCGNEFEIQTQLMRLRRKNKSEICRICNKIEYKLQNDVLNYINSIYDGTIEKYRDSKYEIDIYLPELKLGFEFNGLYWHSELFKNSDYHINKRLYFMDREIRIINIWEDDWKFKNDIVKSIISSNFRIHSIKIYGRECIIKKIEDREVKKFLNENHIQGWCVSKYRYALIHRGEIVSVLTIGGTRKNIGHKNNIGQLEILRFCNKINTIVIGGFSKIFKKAIKDLDFENIITYSDCSMFDGGVYSKNGFYFLGRTDPGYHYIIKGVRKNRFNFTKSNLIKMGFDPDKTERQIMYENGFYRIYDCGNYKFEYKKNMSKTYDQSTMNVSHSNSNVSLIFPVDVSR